MGKQAVFQWQLADALSISEVTLCPKLRHSLPKNEKENIYSIIKNLAKKRETPLPQMVEHKTERSH